ncbi:MAG: hypothetical protein HYZ57_15945 [Acidobacteria bacterium]|nr:hypothetical protein [Acidobacteriota bacterium]
MLFFPQLSTGSLAQFPIIRRYATRTVVNRAHDGSSIKYEDAGAAEVQWDLHYSGLTDEELESLQAFFDSVEGRLQRFTFLDPWGNLLRWSSDLGSIVWTLDPQLQLAGGVDDPAGGTAAFAVTNNGAAAQSISQPLQAPSDFQYCCSVYARSSSPCDLRMILSSPGGSASSLARLASTWRRYTLSGRLPGAGESTTLAFELPAGVSAELYGPQMEPQPGASPYRPTFQQGGVYTAARFRDDEFEVVAHGPDNHAVRLQVVSRPGA